jgi:hypothetical protein
MTRIELFDTVLDNFHIEIHISGHDACKTGDFIT